MNNINAFTHKALASLTVLTIGFSASSAVAAPQRQVVSQGPNGAPKLVKVATGSQPPAISQISPFNLANLAYQGQFKDQGIPATNRLAQNFRGGRISAIEVAKAAVETNRLSAQTLDDARYLASLKSQLQSLSQPN